MLKIRRPLGRLIFNMGITIPGKTVFLIETAPWTPKTQRHIGKSFKNWDQKEIKYQTRHIQSTAWWWQCQWWAKHRNGKMENGLRSVMQSQWRDRVRQWRLYWRHQKSLRQASATINRPIALQETVNSLKTLQNGKAAGVDNIVNEIPKVQTIQNCPHSLFASCFEYGMVPRRIWLQGIIHPILKNGKNPLFLLTIAVLAWCQPHVKRSVLSPVTGLFYIWNSMDCSRMN